LRISQAKPLAALFKSKRKGKEEDGGLEFGRRGKEEDEGEMREK
jgi:hypothetical protein